MVKISKDDLDLWFEETKDVKKINKSRSLKEEVHEVSDEEINKIQKTKKDSEVIYNQIMTESETKSNSGNFERISVPASYNEEILFKRKSIDNKTFLKLKQGKFRYEGFLDLHSLTLTEAQKKLTEFMYDSHNNGKRCVIVSHGKGKKNSESIGKIKQKISMWLESFDFVLAFASTIPKDGGTGALYVLLKRK